MMKLNKLIRAILLLTVTMLTLTACSSNNIVGKWKIDPKDLNAKDFMAASGYSANSLEYLMAETMLKTAEISMEFTKDGRLITHTSIMGKDIQQEQEYKVQGNVIHSGESATKFQINNNQLILIDGENTIVLTRE